MAAPVEAGNEFGMGGMEPLKPCCPPSVPHPPPAVPPKAVSIPVRPPVPAPSRPPQVAPAPARAPPPPQAPSLTGALATPALQSRCRILVCAPSNAAVDEIVLRLVTGGVWGPGGERIKPRVVRTGSCTSPNADVLAATLDAKVESFLSITRAGGHTQPRIADLLARKEEVARRIRDAQVKIMVGTQDGSLSRCVSLRRLAVY